MKMVQAIVRPEKEQEVIDALEETGVNAFTRQSVFGRGRQRGIQVGMVHYEELAKVLIMTAVEDDQVDRVMETIQVAARTGNPGDGKLFVSHLTEAITIHHN
jgi:nitrogen regulatory protein PII 1